jgi:hypothetical protein
VTAEETEQLFWTVMRRFECQALAQYQDHVPALISDEKRRWVDELRALAPDDALLSTSALGAPMDELQAAAGQAHDPRSAVVVQGLVLERVRRVVYDAVGASSTVSEATRARAQKGRSISAALVDASPRSFAELNGGEAAFPVFAEASDDVLQRLDAVGESVDAVFGSPFGLGFSDVVGELVADLVPSCVALGMDRRKVMSHLAGALMGL